MMKSIPILMSDVLEIKGNDYFCAEIGDRRGTEIIDFEIIKPVEGALDEIRLYIHPKTGETVGQELAPNVFHTKKGWRRYV